MPVLRKPIEERDLLEAIERATGLERPTANQP
jgi:hypothetical protein